MLRATVRPPGRGTARPLRIGNPRVRAQGYALVDQELEEGLRSLAVPIRNGSGLPVAAMNVSAHASRGTSESIRKELLPLLKEAARRIEDDLRGSAVATASI